MYRIQLVWNREFDWCNYSHPRETLEEAKTAAIDIRDSGDGARVKKVRVLDQDDNIVWQG